MPDGTLLASLVLCAAAALGCTGVLPKGTCEVSAPAVIVSRVTVDRFEATYRVTGRAGAPGEVWLAAHVGPHDFASSDLTPVARGAFRRELDLRLAAPPRRVVALLRVGEIRCRGPSPAVAEGRGPA